MAGLKKLMEKSHDCKWAGHLGREMMFSLLSRSYYWPQLMDEVEVYVRTCMVCQDKG